MNPSMERKVGFLCDFNNDRVYQYEVKLFVLDMDGVENDEAAAPAYRFVFPTRPPTHAVCILGSRVYFFNGYNPNSQFPWEPSAKNARRFDLNFRGNVDCRVVTPDELFPISSMYYAKASPIAVTFSPFEILVFGSDVLIDSEEQVKMLGRSRAFEVYNARSNKWRRLPRLPHDGCHALYLWSGCGEGFPDYLTMAVMHCTCGQVESYCLLVDARDVVISLVLQTGNGSFNLNLHSRQWSKINVNIPKAVKGHFLVAGLHAFTSDARRFHVGDPTSFLELSRLQLSRFDFDMVRRQNYSPSILHLYPFITYNGKRRDTYCNICFVHVKTSPGHDGGREAHILIEVCEVKLDLDPDFVRHESLSTRIEFVGDLFALRLFSL